MSVDCRLLLIGRYPRVLLLLKYDYYICSMQSVAVVGGWK